MLQPGEINVESEVATELGADGGSASGRRAPGEAARGVACELREIGGPYALVNRVRARVNPAPAERLSAIEDFGEHVRGERRNAVKYAPFAPCDCVA